eukprot:383072-Prymnesium_polylepis.1
METVPGSAATISAAGSTCVTAASDLTVAAGSSNEIVSGAVITYSSPADVRIPSARVSETPATQ